MAIPAVGAEIGRAVPDGRGYGPDRRSADAAAARQDERAERHTYGIAALLLLATQLADLLTTWLALHLTQAQPTEVNPLLSLVLHDQGWLGMVALKLIGAGLIFGVSQVAVRLDRLPHRRASVATGECGHCRAGPGECCPGAGLRSLTRPSSLEADAAGHLDRRRVRPGAQHAARDSGSGRGGTRLAAGGFGQGCSTLRQPGYLNRNDTIASRLPAPCKNMRLGFTNAGGAAACLRGRRPWRSPKNGAHWSTTNCPRCSCTCSRWRPLSVWLLDAYGDARHAGAVTIWNSGRELAASAHLVAKAEGLVSRQFGAPILATEAFELPD